MDVDVNALDQPIGELVPEWSPSLLPDGVALTGRYCRLVRLGPEHALGLFEADQTDIRGESWTYLPYGPFADLDAYRAWVVRMSAQTDPLVYVVFDLDLDIARGSSTAAEQSGREAGVLSYLRMSPDAGSIEVGHVHYSPVMQRRRAATEAQYLMMRHAFEDLGYRRYEWKCHALNAASRSAATRLGFRYEGTFRQAAVVKGRNRDTAWFSIVDREWPAVRAALTAWLDPMNFDEDTRQKTHLSRA